MTTPYRIILLDHLKEMDPDTYRQVLTMPKTEREAWIKTQTAAAWATYQDNLHGIKEPTTSDRFLAREMAMAVLLDYPRERHRPDLSDVDKPISELMHQLENDDR